MYTAISSKRPTSIPIIKNHFAASFNPIKLLDGPILSPKPGPILPNAVTAPETEVIKSNPVIDSNIARTPRLKKNTTKNVITEWSTSSATGRPSYFNISTLWG